MADPNGYLAGDNVQLIKGTYRLFRKGVYKRPATEKSAVVEINGKERTIRYSSFKKMMTTTRPTTPTSPPPSDVVTMSREEFNAITDEIESMTKQMKNLELKMKRFN